MGYGGLPDPRPLTGGVNTPASIDAAHTISSLCPGGALPIGNGGILIAVCSIEGTQPSRYSTDGVTPTTTHGIQLPAPISGTPVVFTLRGRAYISAFQIIGEAAGNVMTVSFAEEM